MKAIDAYFENTKEEHKELLLFLHDYLLSFPKVTSKLRYGIPFYDQKKWFCYVNPQKKGGVELAFINGVKMSHPALDSKNRKMVSSILIKDIETTDWDLINSYIELTL